MRLYEMMAEPVLESYIPFRRRDLYMNGHCFRLALALHEKTGWPIVGVRAYGAADSSFSLIDHAGVKMPDGRYLDVRGPLDEMGFLDTMIGGRFEIEELSVGTTTDLQAHAGNAKYDRLHDSVVDRDAERLIARFK
jgi:hypothetical protein